MEQPPNSYESPNYEELSAQSGSVRSSESYSNDSFESITNESGLKSESDSFQSITNESIPNYESDSFKSFSSKANSYSISFSESSSVASEADKDTLNKNKSEKGLLEKWIKILGDQKLQSTTSSKPKLNSVVFQEATVTGSPALQCYCSTKIHLLHHQSTTSKHDKQHPRPHSSGLIKKNPSCNIPGELMNRLQLKSMKETMKQVLQAEMHDPFSCPDCSHKQAEMAQSQFVKIRKSKLESDLLQIKLEEFAYSKDLVNRIGEIHQSLPKPSDDSSAIWQKLCASVKT